MANGLLDLLGGLGTTPPAYLEGLLGAQPVEDLRKRSIGTGIANALIGYLATPKNQNLGLGRILANTAQAGLQGAQGVYEGATADYLQGQKIAELQRAKEQREARELAISQLPAEQQALYRAYGETAIPKLVEAAMPKQKERKTATVDNVVIDTDTGLPIYTGEKQAKALPTYKVQRGRTEYTIQVQPDGTEKVIGQGAMDAPQQPKELSYTVQTDANGNAVYVPNRPNSPALDMMGRPTTFKPAPTAAEAKVQEKAAQAKKLPVLINEAEKLIQGATGSYLGAGADIAARTVGISTEGAKNIASLKALEANLVLAMPRLEGPQSNLDQQLYREAAAQIGDPTVPAGTKQAALDTIKKINTTYDSVSQPAQTNQPQSQPAKARNKADILKQYGL
jgi:hypothetical protein